MNVKASKILTHAVTFILGAVIGAGVYGVIDNVTERPDVSGEYLSESPGGMVVDSGDNASDSFISITSAQIPVSEYSAQGLSSEIDSAQTLTATISPSVTDDMVAFTWTHKFSNPASEWATGKDINEYVTLNFTDNDPLSCTVTCKKAFGEPIVVTITYKYDSTISASCNLQYLQRIESVKFENYNFSNLGEGEDENGTLAITFGTGTILGNFATTTAYAEVGSDAMDAVADYRDALESYTNNDLGFDGNSAPQTVSVGNVTGSGVYDCHVSVDWTDFVGGYYNPEYPDVQDYVYAILTVLSKRETESCRIAVNYTYSLPAANYTYTGKVYSEWGNPSNNFPSKFNISGVNITHEGDMYF